jgi:hypothetical protein
MTKKELLITGLLIVSLIFNYTTWNELQEVKNGQQMYALKNELHGLRNDISFVRNQIDKISEENAWIQETSFQVDEEKSSFNTIFLKGQWTFAELTNDQTPYLLLKEEGNEWKQISLNKLNGLTYGVELELSTQKKYDYKIFTKGSISRATENRQIPYEKYGLPEIGVKYGSTHSSGDNKIEFYFVADLRPNVPIMEMAPDEIYIEVKRNGNVEKQLPFTLDDHGNNWEANWTLENMELLKEYKLFIVSKYRNGFIQRKEVEQFNNEEIKSHNP